MTPPPTLTEAAAIAQNTALLQSKAPPKGIAPGAKQIALVALAISGCSILQPAPSPHPVQFTYTTAHGEAAGLVRVFDLKGNTVLQFIDISKAQPKVYGADQAAPLPYDVIGQYAILAGVHAALRIEASGGNATASRLALVAAFAPTAAPPVPVLGLAPATESTTLPGLSAAISAENETTLLEVLAELARAKKDLAQLQQQIHPALPMIVPDNDKSRAWVLASNTTLNENLAGMARDVGYAEPSWKRSTPYMVRYRTNYSGTFLEALAQISDAVPRLDFKVSKQHRTIEIVGARPIQAKHCPSKTPAAASSSSPLQLASCRPLRTTQYDLRHIGDVPNAIPTHCR